MTYQKFSDRSKSEVSIYTPAKVAKPAKVEPERSSVSAEPQNLAAETFATIATFAGVDLKTEFFAARRSTDPKEWHRGVRRLDIDRPLDGVPPGRWRTFVTDAVRFLAGPFARQASALGWTALDLFGCDDACPFARLDQAGLIWLLNGDKLIALTAETAVIQTRTGARHTWYRRPSEPGRGLVWERPDDTGCR
jgi:hypothetical protein